MGLKILVIEDDPDCLEIISYILEHEGYEVNASLTADVLEIGGEFDLIILDEILASTRGSSLCKSLKIYPATAHIPIILISAVSHLGPIAAECNADAFLEKPFEIAALEKLVKSVLVKKAV